MQNRLASLFALDELLGSKPNGSRGYGAVKRKRRKAKQRLPNAGSPVTSAPGHSTYAPAKQARKVLAQSFDAGAPIRCEHGGPYTPVELVQLPSESAPSGVALSFDVGEGYTVEAFEEDEDEEDPSTALPALNAEYSDVDDYAAEAIRASSYEPRQQGSLPRVNYERTQPAAFAAQMSAVEQDLADLATRVQQPEATPATVPAADEDQTPESPAPPVSSSGHGVFDSMAQGMSYATEFRLPAVQLSQVFSALDRQLDAEAVTSTPVPSDRPVVEAATPLTAIEVIPPNEVLIKDILDLPSPSDADTVFASAAIDVRHEVQLVPQLTGYSCWAAGAAMLVGWRDKMSIDPSEIARATGYWAQYATGLQPEDVHMFKVWRLTPEAAQTYTVLGFADLLKRHGPLWVASAEPGPHIRVVTGMVGDGTATGTLVYINDPWEQGMHSFRPGNRGSRYTETYQRFVEKQNELGRREINVQGIYVAHN